MMQKFMVIKRVANFMNLQPLETKKLNGSFYSLNIQIVWENEHFNLHIILNEVNRGKR